MIDATEDKLMMDEVQIDPRWALCIPANLALRQTVLPFASIDGEVLVACLSDKDTQALHAVEKYSMLPAKPIVADEESLRNSIQQIFGTNLSSARPAGASIRSIYQNAKAAGEPEADDLIAICDDLINSAIIRGASDLHLCPEENEVRIRLRVNGSLEHFRTLGKNLQLPLCSRIKVLARLDIAERRAPQDGRLSIDIGDGNTIDIRVATIPTRHGERLTLRFLRKRSDLTLERLGMNADDLQAFNSAISKPHGLILLTGPTGSGKSTTLYAAIRKLIGQRKLNVITVEDPIEYEIEGVDQVETDTADKVNFSKALRSVLRHDPDVLMLGEIRDAETASVAIKSALTGHLVFSTLHTNSAVNAVTRLVDMGVEPYLVGATLRLSVAQRLVTRACRKCRQEKTITIGEAKALGNPELAGQTAFESAGCIFCAGTGVIGQVGLFELLSVSRELARSISDGKPETELAVQAASEGASTLTDDAIAKVREGETSLQQAIEVTSLW
ncbi:MAG: GspE/PulE family protein [Planctomycetota bacterium]|nr:GspE/PulE family protein [Planctomycetota bacterium]